MLGSGAGKATIIIMSMQCPQKDIKTYFISLYFPCRFSLSDCFSAALWAESAEMGLSDGQTAAHQPPLWPSGHTGGSLDGEAWLWAGQVLCSTRKGWEEVVFSFTPHYLFQAWHSYAQLITRWYDVSCLHTSLFLYKPARSKKERAFVRLIQPI